MRRDVFNDRGALVRQCALDLGEARSWQDLARGATSAAAPRLGVGHLFAQAARALRLREAKRFFHASTRGEQADEFGAIATTPALRTSGELPKHTVRNRGAPAVVGLLGVARVPGGVVELPCPRARQRAEHLDRVLEVVL